MGSELRHPESAPLTHHDAGNQSGDSGIDVDHCSSGKVEGSVIAAAFAAEAQEPDEFGLLFAEGNALKACIDPVLEAMRADGTLAALEEEWLTAGTGIFVITG